MSTIDVNKCLVEKGHLGYTEFYNVCTHQVQDVVPWGATNYVEFLVATTMVAVLVAAMVVFGYAVYDMSK